MCSGHTHRRAWAVRERVIPGGGVRRVCLLNPGALWRAAARSAAVVDLSDPAAPACEFLDVPRPPS